MYAPKPAHRLPGSQGHLKHLQAALSLLRAGRAPSRQKRRSEDRLPH